MDERRDSPAGTRQLRPALAAEGVRLLEPSDYTENTALIAAYFRSEIYPLLTPLAVDPGHPFPYVSHRNINFAVVLRAGRARVRSGEGSTGVPRFVPNPSSDGGRYT